jgi:peptide/nickel transport system substrate-binding protein
MRFSSEKIYVPFAIVLVLSLVITGYRFYPALSSSAKYTEGPTNLDPTEHCVFVAGAIADASVLLPVLASDSPSLDVTRLIFNGLVKYDKNAQLVGDLATRWEVSEDNRKIRFFLRKGVKWHDGAPFDARDVEYTYKVYIDPKTPTSWATDFMKIRQLRILDSHTVEVTYDQPYAPALESWDQGILPRHLLEGQDITKSPLQRSPIGTGPYRFASWETADKICLTANPDYFEGNPPIEQVIVRVIPDAATRFLLLKAGEIDRMDLTPIQCRRQTDSEWFRTNFTKYKYLHFGYTYLGYNLRHWKFQDRRVRQALTYAIDRQRIVKCVLMGLGQVAHSPYKPDTYWHNPNVKKLPHDPDRAKSLLAEAGWKDTDGDGILDKDGHPFVFTIITNQGNEQRKNAATLIQRDLKKIGIKVRIRILEWAALIKNFIHKRNFEACLMGWGIPVDPNQIDIWNSTKTSERGLNFITYQNPEVDRLLDMGAATFAPNERKKYYDRFQEIIAEDQPYTFLWVQEDLPIISSRFYGIEPSAMGIDHNFAHWYVPDATWKYCMWP